MSKRKELTYSEAIEQVMLNNGNFAPLRILYEQIWNYKDKSKITGKTPDKTVQERVQRDSRFTRIAKGVYALTDFIEDLEREDLGFFSIEEDEIVFRKTKEFENTEEIVKQRVRIGQSYFRKKLFTEMKRCPITGIDEKRILIASHIKPWSHSNNEERVNVKNGLLLSPLFDKLFDKGVGWITFTLDKEILISKKLTIRNRERLNVSNKQKLENLDIDGREEFLEYHRKIIFQG